jgi:hypothetical protein
MADPFPLPFNPADPGQLQASIANCAWQIISSLEWANRIWAKVEQARLNGDLADPAGVFRYTDEQIAYLDRLVSDLHSLHLVATGQMAQPEPYDFLDVPSRETGWR